MLPVLTQRSAICMCLVRLEAWHALMQGFAGQAEPIRGLAGPTARALAKTLTVASSGLNNVKEGQDYINHLLQPLVGARSLQSLQENPKACKAMPPFGPCIVADI